MEVIAMKSLLCRRNVGLVCVFGCLLAAYALSLAHASEAAQVQDSKRATEEQRAVPLPPIEPGSTIQAQLPAGNDVPSPARGAEPVRPNAAQAQSQTIEQLLGQLQDLRAKKVELERQEKEVIAAVKTKLKDQREILQKLGIRLDESAPRVTPNPNSP
jgi:hypothetical protein